MFKQIIGEYRIINIREVMRRPSTKEFTDLMVRVIAVASSGLLLYIIISALFNDGNLMIVTNKNGELYPMLGILASVTLFSFYKFVERMWELEMSARKAKQTGPMPDFKEIEPEPKIITEPEPPVPQKRTRRKATSNVELVQPIIAEVAPIIEPEAQTYDEPSQYPVEDETPKDNGYLLVAIVWGVIVVVGVVLVLIFTM